MSSQLLHTLDSVGLFLHVSHAQGAVWVPASPLLPVELPGQLMLCLQDIKAAFEEATKLATNPLKAALVVLLKGQMGKDRFSPDAKKVTDDQDRVSAVIITLYANGNQLCVALAGNAPDMLHVSHSFGLGQP